MARKLNYPVRLHTRISEPTEKELAKMAAVLNVAPGIAIRLILEKALHDTPIKKPASSEAIKLLKKWIRKFSRPHPASQNWNDIKHLVEESKGAIEK